jgi:hypothetical protein
MLQEQQQTTQPRVVRKRRKKAGGGYIHSLKYTGRSIFGQPNILHRVRALGRPRGPAPAGRVVPLGPSPNFRSV